MVNSKLSTHILIRKNKLKEFHDAIIEDDGNSNINDQIAKLQDGMKATDSRYDFPKIDRSGIDKTMTIVNNVSEILESSRTKNKRLYTYRDKEIKKVGSSEDNEISILEENIIDEEIKDEDSKTQQKSQFVNGDDKVSQKISFILLRYHTKFRMVRNALLSCKSPLQIYLMKSRMIIPRNHHKVQN